jgi:hypothetical protein
VEFPIKATTTMPKIVILPSNYKADDWIAIGVAARNIVAACTRAMCDTRVPPRCVGR